MFLLWNLIFFFLFKKMSEYQFFVSLFDKKFITEESDHNTSSSSSTTSNSLSFSPQQSRQSLFGKQFWPTSKPIRDDYVITSNSIFGSTFGSNLLPTTTSPIKKFFNKIWNKMNPNEFL